MATPRSAVRAAERRTAASSLPAVLPSAVLLLALVASGAAIYAVTDGLTAWTLDQRRDTRIATGAMRLPAIDVRNQRGGGARWFGADSAGPRIYLVDEPTEGLMPKAVDEIGGLIAGLAKDGAAVVLVEQNLPLVRSVATRVALMNNGRIEATVETLGAEEAERYLGV